MVRDVQLSGGGNWTNQTTLNVGVGGSGGTGADAGAVSVSNSAALATSGAMRMVSARRVSAAAAAPVALRSVCEAGQERGIPRSASISAAMAGPAAWAVSITVDNSARIQTTQYGAVGHRRD